MIQEYHRKLIYDFQNLDNFGNPEHQKLFGTPESKMWFYLGNYKRTTKRKNEDGDHPDNDRELESCDASVSLDSDLEIPED